MALPSAPDRERAGSCKVLQLAVALRSTSSGLTGMELDPIVTYHIPLCESSLCCFRGYASHRNNWHYQSRPHSATCGGECTASDHLLCTANLYRKIWIADLFCPASYGRSGRRTVPSIAAWHLHPLKR